MAGFIHLRAHSAYSLLRGAITVPKLVELAAAQRMPALALTDHDNLFGSLEFSQAALKKGIQPIIGYTASLQPLQESNGRTAPDQLLLYAKDAQGYEHLLALASEAYTNPVGHAPLLSYAQLERYHAGLMVLTAGIHGGIGKYLASQRTKEARELLLYLKGLFDDRLYIELNRHRHPTEKLIERGLLDLAVAEGLPLIATNQIYFATSDMYEAHDALLCVADGKYVMEEGREKLNPEYRFKSAQEMQLLFRDIPEAIENTVHFAKRCSVWSPARAPILPGFRMEDAAGNVLSESEALRMKAHEGLQKRLATHKFREGMSEEEKAIIAKPYIERLDFELDVIIAMKFPGYFLIVSDFITWAKEQGIPVGPGRGSGAGSVVAWVLLITDLDPLQFGLLFERFLNPERVSMPDFDVDFCQDRRDEVIRYVQEKYGADRVAQIITFGKLQPRAVLRDVGRVLQMPYTQVDRICKLVPNNPANPVTLAQAIEVEPLLKQEIESQESVDKLVSLGMKLEGLYRHASTHAAGVVIADRPLNEIVPLYRDPKSDLLVVQYSMKYAEEAGLVKFDFLGLKTLTVLKNTVDMLASRGIAVNLETLPFDDKPTYALLTRAETLGVFQFESAGMQMYLKQLKPDCLEDLIALGALYRPGPMENIPLYIARKHGKEKVETLHPMLKEVLEETYGVIIYQEQVQKIAQVLAGYTLGAADLLRRAMGKKIKAEMDAQRVIFVEGAVKNGVNAEQATNIFELVAKFAGYGFNKSHAAAYAVVAYQTAYLKANYPVEFIAASMNYEMHDTDKLSAFAQDAKQLGITLLPPDINRSQSRFCVEVLSNGSLAIRYGLSAIRNVGAQAMEALIVERTLHQPFASLTEFAERVPANVLNRRQLENLVAAGAFDNISPNRRQIFESIDMLISMAALASADRESTQINLFGGPAHPSPTQQVALKPVSDWGALDRLNKEFEAIGFYLSEHPLSAHREITKSLGILQSADANKKLGANLQRQKLAGVVMDFRIRASARGRFGIVELSDESGHFEVVIYDETLLGEVHGLLKTGAMLYVEVDAKAEEGRTKRMARVIQLLDEKLQTGRLQSLAMHVSAPADFQQLKKILGAPVAGGAQVQVRVKTSLGTVVIRLKDSFDIAQMQLQQLKEQPHITVKAA